MCFHYLYWNKSLLWRNWLKRLFYKSTNRNIMSFFLINLDVNSKTQIYWTFLLKSSAQIRSKLWHLSICFEGDKQTANKPNVQPKHPTNKGPNDQTYRTKDQKTKPTEQRTKGPNDQPYRTKGQTTKPTEQRTRPTEQSPFWKSIWSSVAQGIACTLRDHKINYRIVDSRPMVPILKEVRCKPALVLFGKDSDWYGILHTCSCTITRFFNLPIQCTCGLHEDKW